MLAMQKYGDNSTKRLDQEMVLARSKIVNLVCMCHIFHMLADLFAVMMRILSRNTCSIFM